MQSVSKYLKLLKGKVSIFLINRYLTYFLKFVKTFAIAAVLGPYYFGIWGFITLILQYLSYSNIGLQYSLNVLLSTSEKGNSKNASIIVSSSMIITAFIGFLLLILGIAPFIFGFKIFPKYSFSNYVILVAVIAILRNFNQLFINLYRSYGYLYKISISQFLLEAALLPFVFIYKGEGLINILLWVRIIVYIFSLILFGFNSPVKFSIQIAWEKIILILKRGFNLLVYNASFYLIMVSSRTIISSDYEVQKMGYYSFANNIAYAALMGLGAIAWILFPKMLYKTRSAVPNNKAYDLVSKLMSLYVTFNFLLVFTVITVFPLFIQFLDRYKEVMPTFVFLMLAQGVFSYCFGYSGLAISRKHEIKLATIGFITIIINVLIALFFSRILHLDYSYIAFGTLLSSSFYVIILLKTVYNILGLGDKKNIIKIINEVFSLKIFIPFFIVLVGNFTVYNNYFNITALILFLVLNLSKLLNVIDRGKVIFTDPSIINPK
ncbi:MAG: lipopolysaccharide biosynthesis protein [Atribacterota bacterium]